MHGAIALCSPRAAHDVGKGGRRHRCSSTFTEGSSGEKQACRFILVSFCFYDALLSQPDRMRNKYHQNTTREAILEVFIVQPHWKMFGHPPGKPILTVLSSPFLNFWALTQTESGLLKFSYLCLRESPVWVSHGRAAEGKSAMKSQRNPDRLCWCCRWWWWYPHLQLYPPAACFAWVNDQSDCTYPADLLIAKGFIKLMGSLGIFNLGIWRLN